MPKRTVVPSFCIMEAQAGEHLLKIRNVLKMPLEDKDGDDLKRVAHNAKTLYDEYKAHNMARVKALITKGCANEATSIRSERLTISEEVNELINICNTLTKCSVESQISDVDAQSSIGDGGINKCAGETSSQNGAENNQLTDPDHSLQGATNIQTDFDQLNADSEAHNQNDTLPQYIRDQAIVNGNAPEVTLISQSTHSMFQENAIAETTSCAGLPRPQQLQQMTSRGASTNFPSYTTVGRSGLAMNTPTHAARVTFNNVANTSTNQHYRAPIPSLMPITSDNAVLNSHFGGTTHEPKLSRRNNPAAYYLQKQSLFTRSSNPYAGNPAYFYSWVKTIEHQMRDIELDSVDILRILEANTTGLPQRLIQEHWAAGGANLDQTLNRVWALLFQQFGSHTQILHALTQRVQSTHTITSVREMTKIRELLTTCRLIAANIIDIPELHSFHISTGLKNIWSKLPDVLQSKWRSHGCDYERTHNGIHPPFEEFLRFFETQVLDLGNPNYSCAVIEQKDTMKRAKVYRTDGPTAPKDEHCCPIHKTSNHDLLKCREFAKMKLPDRKKVVFSAKLCFICLGNHVAARCPRTVKCSQCSGSHHSLMHYHKRNYNSSSSVAKGNTGEDAPNTQEVDKALCTKVCGNEAGRKCSKTVLVDIFIDDKIDPLRCYAVLDEQSTSSFADPVLLEYFKISAPIHNYTLSTLAGLTTNVHGQIIPNLKIRGVGETKVYDLPPLWTNENLRCSKSQVATPDIVKAHAHLSKYASSFNDIDRDAEVLLLIGLDSGDLLHTKCYGNRYPYVHHTALGWALVGMACPQDESMFNQTKRVLRTNVALDHEHYSVRQSFDYDKKETQAILKNVFHASPDEEMDGYSQEERKFLDLMKNNIKTTGNRITLPLPFKVEDPQLPDNKQAVFCRTRNTLFRLKNDKKKLVSCVENMKMNIDQKYVEQVPESELTPNKGKAWWLPIFPVVHPLKDKVRLVYDASASYGGTCLNKELMSGPDQNNRLRGVLLRFRLHEVGFCSDLEQMFNQFKVEVRHRDFLRFYWFNNNEPSREIVQYRCTTHAFGLTSSPAVANFGLRHAALHPDASIYPEARMFIESSFYVDDGIASAPSAADAIHILTSAKAILDRFGINLHKINSNSPQVLEAFSEKELVNKPTLLQICDPAVHKTLGVAWNTATDNLELTFNVPDKPYTRRGVLSMVGSLFDPLGIACPITLQGKLLQRAIISSVKSPGVNWDSPLPAEYLDRWVAWLKSLEKCSTINVPRCYKPKFFGQSTRLELHAFADASDLAIGSVVYAKSFSDNDTAVGFVFGSSKVAPRAATTIPRLELCAALETCYLVRNIVGEMFESVDAVYLYTDSTVVLGYLNNATRQFTKYVTRRINLILSHYDAGHWRYVSTNDNPADIATRPHTGDELKRTTWFLGPPFLQQNKVSTPQTFDLSETALPETIDSVCSLQTKTKELPLFSRLFKRSSSYLFAVKVVQRVRLFCDTVRMHARRKHGHSENDVSNISVDEAIKVIITNAQQESYADVLSILSKCESLPTTHELCCLSPFIDNDGLLRVGGRLRHAPLPYHNKYPIILSPKCNLTPLIVRHYHEKTRHQGRLLSMAALREAGYFVQKGTQLMKTLIKDCVTCRKLRGRCSGQQMSDLPPDRLEMCPPFTNTGIDVFGPFSVMDGIQTRRSSPRKVWALLCTCLVTRAIHLEPLSGLDTSSFKNALRRFLSIRGACKRIRSDLGTNFVGAHNQDEAALSTADIAKAVEMEDVTWEFNPPHSSHFGGVWETKIAAVRRILDASVLQMGSRTFSRDEFHTVLLEAAAIVNNTPLWNVPSSADDPMPLSPAMLLTLKETPNPPQLHDFKSTDVMSYGQRRWRRVQAISDYFWKRWQRDYLQELQMRQKWMKPKPSIRPGDVVLIKEESLKRNCWPLGRVEDVKQSGDKKARSATVKRAFDGKSVYRKIHDLVLLFRSTDEPERSGE